jgi:hypothetical protein
MVEERAEGARPDIVGADQPQPVDPILVGKRRGARCSVVHAAASLNWKMRSSTVRLPATDLLRKTRLSP